jgi:hypothetical protein
MAAGPSSQHLLQPNGHRRDQAITQRKALNVTRRLSNKVGQAHAYSGLGRAYFRLARYEAPR